MVTSNENTYWNIRLSDSLQWQAVSDQVYSRRIHENGWSDIQRRHHSILILK